MATKKRGVTVAVTGASGYLAAALIRRLAADDGVERILGFDVRPPADVHDKLVFDEVDVRHPGLAARLEGVDCLVHLAFVMDPIREEGLMRDVNVNGSQNVFKSAGRAGVSRLVYASSAVVYGAHPDNAIPLTESAPLRANLDFSYAAHKLEVEYVVREFAGEFPDAHVVMLRPAMVLGPHADNAWSHFLELPVLLGVAGYSPPLQVVHEDDVARALQWAVTTPERGIFNVAAPGWLEADEALAVARRTVRRVPEPVAFALAERLWRLGLAEVPPGYLHYAMHPWVVSTDKLAAAGFTCERGNEETLREAVAASGGHVRIGRTRVRRGDLVKGAAAGLGLAGAAGLAALLRSRRRSAA
jgi:nucleoside-diphosphate-sugar epimerase